MNIIQFIFTLVSKFVPIPSKDYAEMLNDADNWYRSIRHYDKDNPETNQALNKIKVHAESWYVKLGLAILFIFAVRWVAEFMQGADKPNEDDLTK